MFLASCQIAEETVSNNDKQDPLHILATTIHKTNAINPSNFFATSHLNVKEPETYEWAINGSHAQSWAHAIHEEIEHLEKNKMWQLVSDQSIELGHRPLYGKWVFQVKRDVNGAIARFKARWVIQGYLQQFGIDFDLTFVAVVKPMAFKILFVIAAYYNIDINQMTVKTAFFYGQIDQLVYVQIPKESEDATNKRMVCKLLKALYGLKQAPRLWYKRLSKFLLERLGLQHINADHSIFVTFARINSAIVSTFLTISRLWKQKNQVILRESRLN